MMKDFQSACEIEMLKEENAFKSVYLSLAEEDRIKNRVRHQIKRIFLFFFVEETTKEVVKRRMCLCVGIYSSI